jgi:hypothetical protein
LESEAFGVLEAAILGEVKGSRSSASEGSAFVFDEEQTVSVKSEI